MLGNRRRINHEPPLPFSAAATMPIATMPMMAPSPPTLPSSTPAALSNVASSFHDDDVTTSSPLASFASSSTCDANDETAPSLAASASLLRRSAPARRAPPPASTLPALQLGAFLFFSSSPSPPSFSSFSSFSSLPSVSHWSAPAAGNSHCYPALPFVAYAPSMTHHAQVPPSLLAARIIPAAQKGDFFRTEAPVLSVLMQHPHPNISAPVAVISEHPPLALLYERMEGRDVHSILKDALKHPGAKPTSHGGGGASGLNPRALPGPGFSEHAARHIFAQVCSAIAHCHSLRLVVGDLKLSKIILTNCSDHAHAAPAPRSTPAAQAGHAAQQTPSTPDDVQRLAEPLFGLAANHHNHTHTHREAPASELLCTCYSGLSQSSRPEAVAHCVRVCDLEKSVLVQHPHQLLESVASHCSPAYVAPEILDRKPYDGFKTDAYSLGIVLYTMLQGAYPFAHASPVGLFEKIRSGQFNMPASISPAAQDLIFRLLERDPARRLSAKDALRHPWLYQSQGRECVASVSEEGLTVATAYAPGVWDFATHHQSAAQFQQYAWPEPVHVDSFSSFSSSSSSSSHAQQDSVPSAMRVDPVPGTSMVSQTSSKRLQTRTQLASDYEVPELAS